MIKEMRRYLSGVEEDFEDSWYDQVNYWFKKDLSLIVEDHNTSGWVGRKVKRAFSIMPKRNPTSKRIDPDYDCWTLKELVDGSFEEFSFGKSGVVSPSPGQTVGEFVMGRKNKYLKRLNSPEWLLEQEPVDWGLDPKDY